MTHYEQLTQEERYQIGALKELGLKNAEIARRIGRSPSTIGRELGRNGDGDRYDARRAQHRTDRRRRTAHKANKRHPELIAFVAERLREGWSPEQISGWLAAQEMPLVSHEWIYQQVLADKRIGGDLHRHLRHRYRRYRKRYGTPDRRGRIVGRIGIEQRPAVVETRSRLGDWEGDTIVGRGKAALVSLVDRCSGYLVLSKVNRATAAETARAISTGLGPWADKVHTVTVDNGKEFAQHGRIAEKLRTAVYFADPYSSWQRGTNENTNGLVRQYFPKGTDFDQVAEEAVEAMMHRLNCRPRKRLGYLTPFEVFHECRFDEAA